MTIIDENNADPRTLRAWEARLRREASRQGLVLRKARAVNTWARGPYFIADSTSNALLSSEWGMCLGDVEDFLLAED